MNCAISAATVTNLCKERNYLLPFLMVAAGKLHWNSKLLYLKNLNIMIIYFVVPVEFEFIYVGKPGWVDDICGICGYTYDLFNTNVPFHFI